jgi:OmpA-OmpF porin, OOP family
MKLAILGGIMAATAVTSAAMASDAYDDTGAWYVLPQVQYVFPDAKRNASDGPAAAFAVGNDFATNMAIEAAISYGSFGIRDSGAHDKIMAGGIDVLYKFLPQTSIFRPFLLGGGGALRDKVGGFSGEDSLFVEGGFGALVGLGDQTGSSRLQLRGEVKYRKEFVTGSANFVPDNPGDVIVALGLQVMFGAPVEPPPAPKAAPEVIQEPPPPPPPPPPPEPLDSDGDGVPDSIDRCPNTPKGDAVDAYGCTIKDEIRLPGVTFAVNSAELTPESDQVLAYAVETLRHHQDYVVEVDGHTDSTGSDKLNMALSQHRAESVMAYLKTHGVTNTMTARGFGKTRPIEDNKTAEGRLANRRVTLRILSKS